MDTATKICPKDASHGLMKRQFREGRPNGWRCMKCHNEYVRQRRLDPTTKQRYRDTTVRSRVKAQIRNMEIARQELIARGGTCIHPGCTQTYVEWHHRDPTEKLFVVSQAIRNGNAVEKLKAELKKCDPLCPQHHRADLLIYHEGISENAQIGSIGLRQLEVLAAAREILFSDLSSDEIVRQLKELL